MIGISNAISASGDSDSTATITHYTKKGLNNASSLYSWLTTDIIHENYIFNSNLLYIIDFACRGDLTAVKTSSEKCTIGGSFSGIITGYNSNEVRIDASGSFYYSQWLSSSSKYDTKGPYPLAPNSEQEDTKPKYGNIKINSSRIYTPLLGGIALEYGIGSDVWNYSTVELIEIQLG